MKTITYSCHGCDATYPWVEDYHCPACGEPMSLLTEGPVDIEHLRTAPASLWHYSDLLPIRDPKHIISMGEGATPLISAPALARHFGAASIDIKNETLNPTGSFKDRQISVAISHAVECGCDTVAVVSSGNVGVATAAYAARAGLRAVLFMHGQAGAGKMAQAAAYGAHIFRVDTPSPSEAFTLCLAACRTWGWAHLSTAGMYAPWNVEGAKTIAYELWYQYGGDLPEWIIAPVGGGGLLGGLYRGFLDLQRLRLIDRLPRLVGMQAAGCAPFKWAIDEKISFLETLKHPWPNPKTVAGGIADDIIFDGHTALPAVRRSGGKAIAVGDDAIMEGARLLARKEGILCELTSAGVIPAVGEIAAGHPGDRIGVLITGNGLKELSFYAAHAPAPPVILPTLASLEAAIGQGHYM